MRTHSIAALVLAAILALSACSDDDPDPGDPMSTWTPSGTPEAPSSSATPSADPTEPPLPDAAREATEAGARAFITYYWDLINYAQVTGDVKALREVSGPNCEGCQKGINAVRDVYGNGGSAIGGAYSVHISSVREIAPEDRSLYGVEARYRVRNAKQTITRGDGSVEVSESGSTRYLSYLIWVDETWRTDILEPR